MVSEKSPAADSSLGKGSHRATPYRLLVLAPTFRHFREYVCAIGANRKGITDFMCVTRDEELERLFGQEFDEVVDLGNYLSDAGLGTAMACVKTRVAA